MDDFDEINDTEDTELTDRAAEREFLTEPELDEPLDDENVPTGLACPFCGESRLDYLVIEDDVIECQTCGESYTVA